jgi:hypothetical protein
MESHVHPEGGKVRVDAGGLLSPWDAATLARQLMAAATTAGTWKPCQFCGAPMVWGKTQRGAGMPLSIGAYPAGNVAAWHHGGTLWVRGCGLNSPLKPGEFRVLTHFADCLKYAERTGAKTERALLYKLASAEAENDGRIVAVLDRLLAEADRVRGYPLPHRADSGRRGGPAAGARRNG